MKARIISWIISFLLVSYYVPWMYFRYQFMIENQYAKDLIWSGVGFMCIGMFISIGATLLAGWAIDSMEENK